MNSIHELAARRSCGTIRMVLPMVMVILEVKHDKGYVYGIEYHIVWVSSIGTKFEEVK